MLTSCFFATVPKEYLYAKTPEEKSKIAHKLMQTSKGEYTNGVFAMVKSLIRLLEFKKPSHLAICWDITRDTFRRRMYPDYKANRSETAPELKSQYLLMQGLLEEAGIFQFMDSNLEADDLIGSITKQFEKEIPTYIYTKDQDCLQLVSNFTRLWLVTNKADDFKKLFKVENIPDGVFEFTPMYVEEVYGLTPAQIIDKKALEGDTSDNIPGVKGIGEKSSVPLLQEFGTLENIYEALEEEDTFRATCKELGIRSPIKSLKEGKESAFLSKDLATIRREPLKITLDKLKLSVDEEAINKKFKELEFKSLYKTEMPSQSLQKNELQASLF